MNATNVPIQNARVNGDTHRANIPWQPTMASSLSNASNVSQVDGSLSNGDTQSMYSDCDSLSTIETERIVDRQSVNETNKELWRRELSGRLQMVHVDQYGKVISELEPVPEKAKVGLKSIASFFKVKNSDQKAREEEAWKEAEMIVDDIRSIVSENWA
ncbi:hypothetical protein HDE_07055 [Halotydeus destructor]|nr:hypothetical protein HDE_07055 [Halotydeus destructor]